MRNSGDTKHAHCPPTATHTPLIPVNWAPAQQALLSATLLSSHCTIKTTHYLLVQHDFSSVHPPGLLLANTFSSSHMAMTPATSCCVTSPGTDMRPTYLQVAHAILHTLSEGCGGIRHPPVFRYLSPQETAGKSDRERHLPVTAASSQRAQA